MSQRDAKIHANIFRNLAKKNRREDQMQNFESLVKLARGPTDKTVATALGPKTQAGSKHLHIVGFDIVTGDGTVSISELGDYSRD